MYCVFNSCIGSVYLYVTIGITPAHILSLNRRLAKRGYVCMCVRHAPSNYSGIGRIIFHQPYPRAPIYTLYLINRLLSVHLDNNGVCSAARGVDKEKNIFVTALGVPHTHTVTQTGSKAAAGAHAHNIFLYVYRGSNNSDMYMLLQPVKAMCAEHKRARGSYRGHNSGIKYPCSHTTTATCDVRNLFPI